jgi:tRNA(Ile)-lysidine synthase
MAQVHPAVAATRAAVRAAIAGLKPDDVVFVACSGGADSLALAAALAHESRHVGRSVRSRGFAVRAGAVVVDHGLQPGSDDVAAAAADRRRDLGLDPVVVRRVVVGPDGTGAEDAARRARYAALDDVAAAHGAAAVLLGHTLDDQAEQVLLGLARGSGARSLAGIPPARGIYRRPLLALRRTDLRAACAAQGITWWDDPTNDLPVAEAPKNAAKAGGVVPLRTRVRHTLLPLLADVLGPGAVEGLARTAALLRDDADALDAAAADLLRAARLAAVDGDRAGGDTALVVDEAAQVLDIAVLAQAPTAVRGRALRAAALTVGAPAGATGAVHVAALDALVVDWRGQGGVHLPSGAIAHRVCGTLVLHHGPTGAPTADTPSSQL